MVSVEDAVIAKLRKDGFAIDALPRIGYRLLRRPDKLIPVEIKDGLNTTFIGQEIFYYPKTILITNILI